MDFAYQLREKIDGDIVGLKDLKALFPRLSKVALQNRVARSEELLPVKRGLYVFSNKLRKKALSKFVLASRIYEPSYISFESALSFHGLIPEAVHTTTSACFQRKNKIFTNRYGDFSFDYVPGKPFFMGVCCHQDGGTILVASALKALFDFIYLYKKNYQSIDDMEDDIRIDRHILQEKVTEVTLHELKTLANSYKKNNIKKNYEILVEEFK